MDVHLLTVFPDAPHGGNPTAIVLDAGALTDGEMQDVARHHGFECGFVTSTDGGRIGLRFWVPQHEMSMCGHATVGAVWLLDHLGRLGGDEVTVRTESGLVRARVRGGVEISQPAGRLEPLTDEDAVAVAEVLGVAVAGPIVNAATSRVKTIVPVRDEAALDAIAPDFARIEAVCDRIGSTGLYPYATVGERRFAARQFPRASGYPEDPATGIAATALAFALLDAGVLAPDARPVEVVQGRAMGRPSRLAVRFEITDGAATGCWLGGDVRPLTGL